MKHAVAVALLAAPLAASQAVGGPTYKKLRGVRGADLSSRASSPRNLLQHGSFTTALRDPNEAELMATCSKLSAEGDCNTNDSCTWCKAGAVPDACYPSAMTARLPAGVFQCDGSAKVEGEEIVVTTVIEEGEEEVGEPLIAEVEEPVVEEVKIKKVETFNLKEGVTLTMSAAEVDKDFCDANSPLSLAGYMNVKGSQFDTNNDKNLFYWFFEKRTASQVTPKLQAEDGFWPFSNNNPKPQPIPQPDGGDDIKTEDSETPLVIWLTGGPGCSSSLALLSENGPCTVNDDGKTTAINTYSWTESAHMLWLDQPANVGYSYGQGNDTNEEMISEDAYYFLQAFFQSEQGSKYKDSPLFIVGESYGGHYAPAIAHRIWKGNKDVQDGLIKMNLKGLAVGNGLTDPEEQYKWYAEMGYNNVDRCRKRDSSDCAAIEVFDENTYKMMKNSEGMCTKGIQQCNAGDNTLDSFACQAAFAYCNTALTTPYRATMKNPYDIRKPCGANPLCYDFSHITDFMNSDATKKALHVDEHNPTWQTCNMMINMSFHVDWMKDFAPYVADLLNDGIPALIYAGDVDFICNYMGNRAWTLGLDWDHNKEFNAAEEKDWNNGSGLSRTANGLTFLQVYDAGHMVPSDQPENALTMITQFLNGEAF